MPWVRHQTGDRLAFGMTMHPAPFVVFVVAFALRLIAIILWPDAFQFDAYQRWAGRDHLFVQVWLPATQSIVWLAAKCGVDAYGLRFVFAAFLISLIRMSF